MRNKAEIIQLILNLSRELWLRSDEKEKKIIETFASKIKLFPTDSNLPKNIKDIQAKMLTWTEKDNKLEKDVMDVFFKTDR